MITTFWLGITEGLREIRAHKFRSFLTMLGIILGTAALLSTFAQTAGIVKQFRETLEEFGGVEQITIRPDEVPDHQELKADMSPGMTYDDVVALRTWANLVETVSPNVHERKKVSRGRHELKRGRVRGADKDFIKIDSHRLAAGRFIVDLDNDRKNRVVVIGHYIYEDLFPDMKHRLPVGEKILIDGHSFTIVGVFENYMTEEERIAKEEAKKNPSAKASKKKLSRWRRGRFWFKNQEIVIPFRTFQELFRSAKVVDGVDEGPDRKLTDIVIKVKDVDRLDDAINQCRVILTNTHKGIEDFRFDTRREWFERIESKVSGVRISGAIISGISLLVGGIGIANIMLASITERIREIGIRKAVGAQPVQIFFQILIESSVLSFIGGILGLFLSRGLTEILIFLSPDYSNPVVEPNAVMISMGFALLIGIVAGLLPAWKASQLNPIEALRYD